MNKVSRREVLAGSAAAVVGLGAMKAEAVLSPIEIQSSIKATSGRLKIGVIGAGGKGWSGMQQAAQHGDIVAIADVDLNARIKAMQEYPKADAYVDYRDMLAGMKGGMDAVVISTPDHHHYLASALAMKAGLHCYCEKPLTKSIWEARQLARIARENRVATQMGNQSTAQTPMRKMAKLVQDGHFGAVKEVHLWTNRAASHWKQGMDRPAPARAPREVDFDLWLGPSKERPYGEGYHPFAWRGFWDFGTGALGDMGCHIFNMPYMALDLRDPISVQAKTSGHNRDTFPAWAIVHYVFPATAKRGQVDLFWHDGGKKPDPKIAPGFEYGGNGVIMVCEKATFYCPNEGNGEWFIVGGGTIPDVKIDESPGHMAEFARACQGGPQAVSNFPGYSGPLTETVLLGNLAIWADGPTVEWDARRMTVKGTKEYDSLIRPAYRPSWSL